MSIISGTEALLEPRLVGEIEGRFFVPAYQRGYRWGATEVRRLLDDIRESGGTPYYLQPIVVKAMDDGRWELVDGQQRLTTLFLVLQYIQREVLPSAQPAFSMEYETREGSQDYLMRLDVADSQANIDFFHIYEAYSCLWAWFQSHGQSRIQVALDIYSHLSKSVRVIWYEAPAEVDSTTLFTRLNIGRIPLTDAELVKALLLSRSRHQDHGSDRAQEMAAQWDVIERDLRAPEVWAFVTGEAHDSPTHISLLLDTLAGGPSGRERPLFHTFETLRPQIESGPQQVWDRVVDLHSTILGWYANRDLFHKVGFLTADGDRFDQIVQLAEGKTKSVFEAELDARIRSRLNVSESKLRDLSYRESSRAEKVLLLMNVETLRGMRHSHERYSFRSHASGAWSLEHIHAQKADPLTRADQWTEWLRLHRDALGSLPAIEDEKRRNLLSRVDEALTDVSGDVFRALQREVTAVFEREGASSADDVDTIANLALLSGGDNTALSNSVFEVKRREVLKRDREGSFIPVCTRNVFLKYYTDADAQQIHFWGARDQSAYLEAMVEKVRPYLKPEVVTP